jgi:rhamnosyltransferase
VRRAVFYLFYDPDGRVDDYVLHTLTGLRAHAEHIFVVSNGPLDDANRARLEGVADRVWARENVGYDVWAYKEAMQVFGADALAEFDELVLMNCTFFGPIGSFDELFARMDARTELDFWGITEHGASKQVRDGKVRPLAAHLQSHWIAARHSLFTSEEWATYWRDMPMIVSYDDSIARHEVRLTTFFTDHGYKMAVAYPSDDYDSAHPVMDNVAQMVRDGCPIVKRRSFFHDPLYNERKANDGRQILRLLEERGYPVEQIFANLARTTTPRLMMTNLGLLEVLPDVDLGYDASRPLRVAVVAHVYYPDMTDELLDLVERLPVTPTIVMTTADEARRQEIEAVLARRGVEAEVRLVASNRGRDISAFFIDCADVIESDDHDLVVKLHSKRSPQDGYNIGELFKRHLFENLLGSPGYAANVLRLFQQHSSLGMVIPPVYHIGYPTLGHAWFLNKEAAEEQAERMGIRVPFDDSTPVSAYGSMFIARPQTLRAITRAGYAHDDFPDESGYGDGALSHVLERLMTYAVLSTGHHVREVMNAELAAVNYKFLEYRAIRIGSTLPAYPGQQLNRISKLKQFRRKTLKQGIYDPARREEIRAEREDKRAARRSTGTAGSTGSSPATTTAPRR